MKVECYGATRPRDGGTTNEDAFWIWRPSSIVAAVADGAGAAQHCAAHVLRLFARQIEGGLLQVQSFPAWAHWIRSTDGALAGGSESTFVGVAVVDDRVLGAYAGNSRAYLVNEEGCRILTEHGGRRIGTGEADAAPLHEPLDPHDTLLLMTDGAWTPLPLTLVHRTVMAARLQDFADLPAMLIDIAGKHGRADDMTVVALRRR